MLSFNPWFVALAAVTFTACSSATTPPPVVAAQTPAPRAMVQPQHNAAPAADTPLLALSKNLRERCGITVDETYFAYNSSRVSTSADPVLSQVVTCFTSGPLAGSTLRLVGHADPRGDEEYNYVLGGRRAAEVLQRLQALGLPDRQATASSRGESDAEGQDEATWARDRRVSLDIGS